MAIAIVSYNVRELLGRCLDSVLAQVGPHDDVVVVDNASEDGSAEYVRAAYPRVRVIDNRHNLGFGAANNQAIRATSASLVMLVNPDCEVRPGSLAALAQFMAAHPRAAVAGGRLRYPDGAFQHSAFRFPTLAQVFLDLFPLNWRLTESRLNGRYPRDWDDRTIQIDHPLGAFMAVRRAAIDEVGLFDERYFMYAEEVDWCYRFKRAGWEVWHCPDALAIHHGGRSTRQRAGAMFVQLHRSRLRFFSRHYPWWFAPTARAILRLGMAKLLAQEWLGRARGGASDEERRAHVRACLQVMRL
jgi:N-acetylglucosaminyl-diphospho-decaprenol L-rhamnosyltransferase